MNPEVERIISSGLLSDFVSKKGGAWNHHDWLNLLTRVRLEGYTTTPDDEIGRLLEKEKAKYWVARRREAQLVDSGETSCALLGRPGTSGLRIHRLRQFCGCWETFKVEIDGQTDGKLRNGAAATFSASAGKHTVRVAASFGADSYPVTLQPDTPEHLWCWTDVGKRRQVQLGPSADWHYNKGEPLLKGRLWMWTIFFVGLFIATFSVGPISMAVVRAHP